MRRSALSVSSLSLVSGRAASLAVVLALVLGVLLAGGCESKDVKPADPKAGSAAGKSTDDYDERPAPPPPVVFALAKAAPKPIGPLPAGSSCVTAECHATMANSRQIHGPVSKKACDACHEPDAGGHLYPLKRQGNELCTFCHAVAGTESHQHKALEQGCVTCHDPHVSTTKFLLKADTVESLCLKCHQVPLKRFAHDPFAKGQCTLCHQPHQADNVMLLRGGDGSKECFTCHKQMGERMANAAHVHPPAAKDCNACHSPHATDLAEQLKKPVAETCYSCHDKVKAQVASANLKHGAMLTEKACANCHDPHATAQPGLLKERTDKVCMTCHDKPVQAADGHTIPDMRPSITEAKFLHGPVRAGNCTACHEAHASAEGELLKQAFPRTFYSKFDVKNYALCFSCHDKQMVLTERTTSLTGFRNGDRNLHFVHVNREEKGRSCKSCHDIHGSDQPRHMASEVPFEGSGWSMQIDYQASSDGGRCASGCHKPREYSRTPKPEPTARGAQ